MSKTLRISLIVTGTLVVSALLLWTGILIGRTAWGMAGFLPGAMMNYQSGYGAVPNSGQVPNGMMGGGMMGYGMMGSYASGGLSAVKPLSIEQAQEALEKYLDGLSDPDLEIKEIMIFENHAYAEIVEKSTGIGAMEVSGGPRDTGSISRTRPQYDVESQVWNDVRIRWFWHDGRL